MVTMVTNHGNHGNNGNHGNYGDYGNLLGDIGDSLIPISNADSTICIVVYRWIFSVFTYKERVTTVNFKISPQWDLLDGK